MLSVCRRGVEVFGEKARRSTARWKIVDRVLLALAAACKTSEMGNTCTKSLLNLRFLCRLFDSLASIAMCSETDRS